MKPGDRVRVTRGEHEGRFGVVTDVDARRAAVEKILKPSETRSRLLAKLNIPPGCYAVQLDPNTSKHGDLEVFSAGCLVEVEQPRLLAYYMGESVTASQLEDLENAGLLGHPPAPSPRRLPLDEYLAELELAAITAAGRTIGPLRKKDAGRIFDDRGPWAVGCADDIQAHIFDTRPGVILALIRKLREAQRLLGRSLTEYPSSSDTQATHEAWNRFLDEAAALDWIDIP